jgi:hypothetical protein
VRSPLRSQFSNGAMGTPPDSNKYGLAALSSSPNVRSGWAPQSLMSGFSQNTSHQQQPQQQSPRQQQQQPTQQSLLSQSLLRQPLHAMGQGAGIGEGPVENMGLGANPPVSAPIPVKAGMSLAGIANMGIDRGHADVSARSEDTEDGLFSLDY